MDAIIPFLVLGGIVWFWLDAMKTKEIATQAAWQACRELGVQLLDQTVSVTKMRLRRNHRGRLVLMRIYRFDFSLEGVERLQGRAILYGKIVKQIHLDQPDGMIIEETDHTPRAD
ncbi:MAG: DUF3301 domain-containing protein [bacterium]